VATLFFRQGTASAVPQGHFRTARHFERSDPAFSCARFLGAGSRREKSLFVFFRSLPDICFPQEFIDTAIVALVDFFRSEVRLASRETPLRSQI
jgi:hypothetical protein